MDSIDGQKLHRSLLHFWQPSEITREYKQAIIVRVDLEMGKGKIAVQVAHASVNAILLAYVEFGGQLPEEVIHWINGGYPKIVLKVNSENELILLRMKASVDAGLLNFLVHDAGLTQVPTNTPTALAIGPALSSRVDEYTKGLKLL
jgi:PTH2 family peptidyl-tRNA hydrolase